MEPDTSCQPSSLSPNCPLYLRSNDPTLSLQTPRIPLQATVPADTASRQSVSSVLPSSFQAAVATLQDCKDTEVLAWFKIIRSITTGCEQLLSPFERLSSEQLNAIATLSHCPDDAVLMWLNSSRNGGIPAF